MTDPISDLLTRIRNALAVGKSETVVPYSSFRHNLGKVLETKSWIEKVESIEEGKRKFLKLHLKYHAPGKPVITGLKRISKPGQRRYVKASEISKFLSGRGMVIVSTSKGLLTDQEARREKVGGEILCQIW